MTEPVFCSICPEAELGCWEKGFSAWARCYANGHCGLTEWPEGVTTRPAGEEAGK